MVKTVDVFKKFDTSKNADSLEIVDCEGSELDGLIACCMYQHDDTTRMRYGGIEFFRIAKEGYVYFIKINV